MLAVISTGSLEAGETLYYAHAVVEDDHGVIAPWYGGSNGQLDARLRMAVELYKRYPWVETDRAVQAAPHLIYNTHWRIAEDGTITIPPTHPWMCGDLSQRALSIIQGLAAYCRYSGDPLAFVYVPLTVDYVLDWCLTDPDHPWPSFPIATPTRGVGYRRADPAVPNQLDLCAYLGFEVLRAYKLTGTTRYLEAAKHWGDVFARKCNFDDPSLPPWNRYMSPQHKMWSDELTGGVTLIAEFLDELLALGHTGPDDVIVKARDAARVYLTDNLLAIPESSICCGTSLSHNQYTYAPAFMKYGRLADTKVWIGALSHRPRLSCQPECSGPTWRRSGQAQASRPAVSWPSRAGTSTRRAPRTPTATSTRSPSCGRPRW